MHWIAWCTQIRTALATPFVILSCSPNPEPRIMPELLAHKPVCLTMDWGSSARPSFSGRPAPDTLLLLPERGGRPGSPRTLIRGG
jgi:hypothetical protein